ncbi:MAG TPA: hypothetical protein VIH30_02295, partial [Aquirhabdus sp.]
AKRLEAEQAEKKRLADVEHVRGINRAVIADLLKHGINEDQAKAIITSIAKGSIKHISIQY